MAKKIFNEKKYQKNIKILNIIGISWIVGVIAISIILTISGAYNAKKTINESEVAISSAIEEQNEQTSDFTEIELQPAVPLIDVSGYKGPTNQVELNLALSEIEAKHTIAVGQPGWFEDTSAKNKELMKMNSNFDEYVLKVEHNESALRRQTDVEANSMAKSAQEIIDKVTSAQKGIMSVSSSIFVGGISFISIIGIVITTAVLCLPGLMLIFIANSRSIYAFIAQSSVPVAKESTKQMAPAFGSVAKEVAKGVKSGWNGSDKKKKKTKK